MQTGHEKRRSEFDRPNRKTGREPEKTDQNPDDGFNGPNRKLEQIRAIRAVEKKKKRKQILVIIIVVLAVFFLYMCTGGRADTLHSPWYVLKCIGILIRYKFETIGMSVEERALVRDGILLSFGSGYSIIISRLQKTILIFLSGAVLALSGTIYQTSMRNPMAVPTMLGVSSGVQLAQMILVLLYAEEVYNMAAQRYALSYGISIGVLLAIIGAARLVGRNRTNVADLLIVGTIVNRLFQVIMNYYQSAMDEDTLELYQEFSQESQDYFDSFSDIGMLILVSAIVLMPLILMRFTFNVVSFEDEDAYSVGVKSRFLRFYGIVAGGILTATAMIHAGNVGMLATVVPLLCRYRYGADFRDLLWTSALWGGVILTGADFVRRYTYINDYQIPLGNIISLMAIPFLIWIIRRQQRIFPSMEQ